MTVTVCSSYPSVIESIIIPFVLIGWLAKSKISPTGLSKISSKFIFLKAFHISTSTTLPSSTNILSARNVLITTEMAIRSLPLSSTMTVFSEENLIYQFSSFWGLLDDSLIVITLLKCCFFLFLDWVHFLIVLVMV